MIKQNELELANTIFKIQPKKVDSSFCFLLFVQSFNYSYLWNQLSNLCGVFTKLKPKQYLNRKYQKIKNHIFSTSHSFCLIASHLLLHISGIKNFNFEYNRPLTAKLRWCLFSSVSHVSNRLELHNNNWASGSKHPGSIWKWRLQWRSSGSPIERSVAHGTLIDAPRYPSPWHFNARGTKNAVYYATTRA